MIAGTVTVDEDVDHEAVSRVTECEVYARCHPEPCFGLNLNVATDCTRAVELAFISIDILCQWLVINVDGEFRPGTLVTIAMVTPAAILALQQTCGCERGQR